ncbi:MAG: hypothetical protein AAF570_05435 [Bacteroidota bacterium]
MKSRFIQLLTLALMIGSFSMANAQAVRNTVERAQDRNQIANDKATIQRDRAEITQFRANRQGLGEAIKNGNAGMARAYHMKLVSAMEQEIRQGKAKTAQANREISQSRSETRSSNRELRNSVRNGKPVQAADDARDRRDDRRDTRDDVSDRNERLARTQRQQSILGTFKSIDVSGKNAFEALKAKKNLLEEFEQTMIRDMGENYEELAEDRRELREDRRETREDRRQR